MSLTVLGQLCYIVQGCLQAYQMTFLWHKENLARQKCLQEIFNFIPFSMQKKNLRASTQFILLTFFSFSCSPPSVKFSDVAQQIVESECTATAAAPAAVAVAAAVAASFRSFFLFCSFCNSDKLERIEAFYLYSGLALLAQVRVQAT